MKDILELLALLLFFFFNFGFSLANCISKSKVDLKLLSKLRYLREL